MRRIISLAAMAAAAMTAPAAPARAEFFTFEQLRGMCAGQAADSAEFRTGAAHALLREIYRARCRMYLLGIADGLLRGADGHPSSPACTGRDIGEADIGDRLVEAVLASTGSPEGGATGIVREVLRSRYGCG